MRVLLIDQFAEMGGAQYGLLEAAEGFAARGWELHAVIPNGPLGQRLAPHVASVTIIQCGPFTPARKRPFDILRMAAQLPAQAAAIASESTRHGIDVLYVNGPRLLPAASLARGSRSLVFHAHSVVTQPLARTIAGHALRKPRVSVLASSHYAAGWMAPYVAADRVRVIYNGIRGFDTTRRLRSAFTRIGVLGRIAPEKGQMAFVQAARIAAASNPDLRFTVCGSPMFSSQVYFDAVKSEAAGGVAFEPWTDDVGAFFATIDVLVVPSDEVDANPRVIPEAYAAGVPVVAFASGGVPELVEDRVTGMLVQERTPRALAQAILEAVRVPERLNAMAERAYARFQAHYTLGRFQSEVSEAVEEAAQRQRTPFHKADANARA
jgi:glycosyltransferase involved in cell wall biosynthesis